MSFNEFSFEEITINNVNEILSIIRIVFPYTSFDETIIESKIVSPKFCLKKIVKKNNPNKIIGFIEIAFLSKKIARLNAIFIVEKYRKQGLAKKLFSTCFEKIVETKCEKIVLLVKENNFVAKKFYSKIGFSFEQISKKRIDDSIIEEWGLLINEQKS